ncbi:MAG: hypothetical protein K0R54_1872 [Clostridiaceae bacterium]|jgi:late competence protein required for DNA uptake (superfamily II DNA/RNA helicase)|nr:hypothetical protein [Clostridiaceae bacterium]
MKINIWENKVSEFIYEWSNGNEKVLNITSVPFNSSIYLLKTIISYVYNQKKIMYITGENEKEIDLIDNIKQSTKFRGYTYIRSKSISADSPLVICNYENAEASLEKYDLIIYNEVRSLPVHTKDQIINLAKDKCKENGKIIFYSIEGIENDNKEILLPVNRSRLPQSEPRVVLTRLDINKEIPYVIYEYLNWSLSSMRKVIIYVPSMERLVNVYGHISQCGSNLTKNIYCYHTGDNGKVIINFKHVKDGILITDDFSSIFNNIRNLDKMIFFTNDGLYDYKKLVYLCSSNLQGKKDYRGEIIFLSNSETDDMDTARKIIRDFNREAWERNLLDI